MLIRDGMILVNLHTFYPEIYKKDCFEFVPYKIAKLFQAFEREKEAERKRREYHRLHFLPVTDMDSIIDSGGNMRSILEEILEREKIHWLRKALSTLTATQQRRVVAFYFEGLSLSEIAKRDGVIVSVVSRSIEKALSRLKKAICDNL